MSNSVHWHNYKEIRRRLREKNITSLKSANIREMFKIPIFQLVEAIVQEAKSLKPTTN